MHSTRRASDVLTDWQLYANQLSILGFGIPLWQPAPILHSYKRVKIGDVGYMRGGCFHLLFSAGCPLGSRRVGVDVPVGFVPLNASPVVKLQPRKPGPVKTSSLRVSGSSLGASLNLPTSVVSGGIHLSFESTTSQGAILVTRHKTYRDDAQRLGHFRRYMLDHYESWLAFANDQGHGIRLQDLILVTGRDMTEDFAMLAFSHNQGRLGVEFEAGVPNLASVDAAVWGSWRCDFPVYENWGPQERSPQVDDWEHPSPEDTSLNDYVTMEPHGDNPGPQFNQCVFLRGFRIHRRVKIFPTVIKAGAGPDDVGSPDRADKSVFKVYEDEENDLVDDVDVSSTYTEFQDPLRPIADYIFENSTANLAIVHDDDFIRLLSQPVPDKNKLTSVDDLSEFIQRLSPNLEMIDQILEIARISDAGSIALMGNVGFEPPSISTSQPFTPLEYAMKLSQSSYSPLSEESQVRWPMPTMERQRQGNIDFKLPSSSSSPSPSIYGYQHEPFNHVPQTESCMICEACDHEQPCTRCINNGMHHLCTYDNDRHSSSFDPGPDKVPPLPIFDRDKNENVELSLEQAQHRFNPLRRLHPDSEERNPNEMSLSYERTFL
ncbi:hypothetical protein ABKN59_008349 [Abortiporus biennis]